MGIARRITLGLAALAALVAAPTSTAFAVPRLPSPALTRFESSVLVDINAFRSQHGLARLRRSPQLTSAARAHSQQMARDGSFSHQSANGSAFWKRLRSFYRVLPARSWAVGENLLWTSSVLNGTRALELWLASPPHRRNLLDPRWREIGVSAVHARRLFQGRRKVTIVTTDFGVRR